MDCTRFAFLRSTFPDGPRHRPFERGVGLLESVIIVGLVAVVSALFLPTFYNTYQEYRVETAVRQVEVNLRFARLAAVKKKTMHQVLFRNISGSPPNTYIMMIDKNKNSTFEPDIEIVKNVDTSLPPDLQILTGGITTVTYNARGAATLVGGTTIRIRGTEDTYRINVWTNGAVTSEVE